MEATSCSPGVWSQTFALETWTWSEVKLRPGRCNLSAFNNANALMYWYGMIHTCKRPWAGSFHLLGNLGTLEPRSAGAERLRIPYFGDRYSHYLEFINGSQVDQIRDTLRSQYLCSCSGHGRASFPHQCGHAPSMERWRGD